MGPLNKLPQFVLNQYQEAGLSKASAYSNAEYQSVENAGVAFVKGADERNEFFEKINIRAYSNI